MTDRHAQIGKLRAVLDSFRGVDISHYPRLAPDQEQIPAERLTTAVVRQLNAELSKLIVKEADTEALDAVVISATASLNEVKALTEYQDQKATRLLTIIAFLSALAGALFTMFAHDHPFSNYLAGPYFSYRAAIVVLCYAAFSLFVLCAVCGALVVFHATRMRFKWTPEAEAHADKVRSHLFYDGIVSGTPEAWASEFLAVGMECRIVPVAQIKLAYAKDYIREAYLVASKVADKLRYLAPAQELLHLAVRLLLVWVVLLAVISLARIG